jgi:hypothetical protein
VLHDAAGVASKLEHRVQEATDKVRNKLKAP